MSKRKTIDAILGSKKIAIAGVSRNEKKFGSALMREMRDKGLDVVGLNPRMTGSSEFPCYPGVEALPSDVEALITVVKPDQTLSLIQAAEKKGIRKIWMQQGSQSPEAVAFCREKGIDFVDKACVLMYCEPVASLHRFHRGIAKLFGQYQKAESA